MGSTCRPGGTGLVAIGDTHRAAGRLLETSTSSTGTYSGGATVVIPNDFNATNAAAPCWTRPGVMLKAKEHHATPKDMSTSDPRAEATACARADPGLTWRFNANYALEAKLDPTKDARWPSKAATRPA